MPALLTKETGLVEGWFQPNEQDGLCHCGCGETTDIATESSKKWGYVKGEHYRFCHGHGKMLGADHPGWKGGRRHHSGGYILVKVGDHPAADRWGYVLEHRIVMEKVLGRFLTASEVVHHINQIKDDNRPENLQLFPDCSSHILHHVGLRRSQA